MTHEELLARIAKLSITPETNVVPSELSTALMAVVEMHRPALDSEMDETSDNETLGCAGCGFDFNYDTWEVKYPCRTIQAIEKELK